VLIYNIKQEIQSVLGELGKQYSLRIKNIAKKGYL